MPPDLGMLGASFKQLLAQTPDERLTPDRGAMQLLAAVGEIELRESSAIPASRNVCRTRCEDGMVLTTMAVSNEVKHFYEFPSLG